MVMADTQLTPFDMGTFGSRTTPDMSRQLRRAAAAARETLLDLAAETWKVDRTELTAADGAIVRAGTKETLPYGKLTQGRKLTKTVVGRGADDARRPVDHRRPFGGEGRRPVVRDRRHQYASDIRLPGMWYGKVLRPPSFARRWPRSTLAAARAMPDVVVVRDGDFVGVVAPSEHLAATRPGRDQGRVEARPSDLGQGPVPRAEAAGRIAAARARWPGRRPAGERRLDRRRA